MNEHCYQLKMQPGRLQIDYPLDAPVVYRPAVYGQCQQEPGLLCPAKTSDVPLQFMLTLPPGVSTLTEHIQASPATLSYLRAVIGSILTMLEQMESRGFDLSSVILDPSAVYITEDQQLMLVCLPVSGNSPAPCAVKLLLQKLQNQSDQPLWTEMRELLQQPRITLTQLREALYPSGHGASGQQKRDPQAEARAFDLAASIPVTPVQDGMAPVASQQSAAPAAPAEHRENQGKDKPALSMPALIISGVIAIIVFFIMKGVYNPYIITVYLLYGVINFPLHLNHVVGVLVWYAGYWLISRLAAPGSPGEARSIKADAHTAGLRIIYAGGNKGVMIPIDRSPFVIGRDADNQLQVKHQTVSAHHAQITLDRGRYTLCDLGSTNKTRLNGRILAPNQPYPLHAGDIIAFAEQQYEFIQT